MLEARVQLQLPSLGAGMKLALAPLGAIVSVAAYDGAAERLSAALGVALPRQPRLLTADGVTWLWSGNDSWLALADDAALAGRLATAAQNLAAVADQSHGRVILRLAGPGAADLLARLVPIDLDPQAFPPDATALTLAGHIGVQLWRDDAGGFALACFTSFAQALADALAEAGRHLNRERASDV